MADRLDIFKDRDTGKFQIAWDDEGHPGLYLRDAMPRRASQEDRAEHTAAADAARLVDGTLAWESEREATRALKAARAAAKAARAGRPWPEWAMMAKAAGWSAPKGWKP